jgi:uncharacterized membrane protein YphA (DoxX/SURF4 family)
MKLITSIVRVLFGTLLLLSSIVYFLNLYPQQELTGEMKIFSEGIDALIYLMPLVKAIELSCGLAFLLNRFIPLATITIFPISVNILGVHIFLAPKAYPLQFLSLLQICFWPIKVEGILKGFFQVK